MKPFKILLTIFMAIIIAGIGSSNAQQDNISYERDGNFLLKKTVKTDTLMKFIFDEGVDRKDFTGQDLKKMFEGGVVKKEKGNILSSAWPILKTRLFGAFYKMHEGTVYKAKEGFIGPEKNNRGFILFGEIIPFILLFVLFSFIKEKKVVYFFLISITILALIIFVGHLLNNVTAGGIIGVVLGVIIFGYASYNTRDQNNRNSEYVSHVGGFIGGLFGGIVGGVAGFELTGAVWQYLLVYAVLFAAAFILRKVILSISKGKSLKEA